jgi:hypothetical protein
MDSPNILPSSLLGGTDKNSEHLNWYSKFRAATDALERWCERTVVDAVACLLGVRCFEACIGDTTGSRRVGGSVRAADCHKLQHRVLHLFFFSSSSSLFHITYRLTSIRLNSVDPSTSKSLSLFAEQGVANCDVPGGYANVRTRGAETTASILSMTAPELYNLHSLHHQFVYFRRPSNSCTRKKERRRKGEQKTRKERKEIREQRLV